MGAESLVGMRFARLLVCEALPSTQYGRRYRCVCDCGKEKITYAKRLLGAQVKSCGCLRKEAATALGKLPRATHNPRKVRPTPPARKLDAVFYNPADRRAGR